MATRAKFCVDWYDSHREIAQNVPLKEVEKGHFFNFFWKDPDTLVGE